MIVEDCAHAFGAKFNNKKIGNNIANSICIFSLQAIKHLTTGDGGIITLPNKILYNRCKLLRWYGINRDERNYQGKDFRLENDIIEYGYKYHMNDINATIGLYNLPHISGLLQKNRENAEYYNQCFKGITKIKILSGGHNSNSAYWLYSIRVENKTDFISKMEERGIMTSQVHNRNDIHTCVKKYREKLPNLDILETDLVCLPVGWWLTKEDKEHIVKSILEILKISLTI